MVRVKCLKCGQSYPQKAGHRCPAEGEPPPEANDNADRPFDEKRWRREYMRDYMREWRRRKQPQDQPKDQAS